MSVHLVVVVPNAQKVASHTIGVVVGHSCHTLSFSSYYIPPCVVRMRIEAWGAAAAALPVHAARAKQASNKAFSLFESSQKYLGYIMSSFGRVSRPETKNARKRYRTTAFEFAAR